MAKCIKCGNEGDFTSSFCETCLGIGEKLSSEEMQGIIENIELICSACGAGKLTRLDNDPGMDTPLGSYKFQCDSCGQCF